ncbi:putative sodium/calcium transporter [Penicillium brasilianum]|uniref:Putative sodium/calcium transporter n=1 Tax=Penicillium brasilianum TaxID=104259 RepID=A0A1S9RIG5_PENBI|nr:putative sodium/calcium transporter [Penicillium brasilianum]
MHRDSRRPGSSYPLEVPLESVPSRPSEIQSQLGSPVPEIIVEGPEFVHRLSYASGDWQTASAAMQVDHAIISARTSRRGIGSLLCAPIIGLWSLMPNLGLTSEGLSLKCQIAYIFLGDYLNLLLVAIPAGIVVNYTPVPQIAVFFVNFVAIIPSSKILGLAMDELEIYLEGKSVLIGLITCTFGNAVQLIQSVLLLKNKQLDVLRVSLLGTILTNLLLLTGLSFLIGGIRYHEQVFDKNLTQTITMLLFLAILSLVVPTASHYLSNIDNAGILAQSRGTAVVIIISYVLWLIFDLKTHRPIEALYQNTVIQENRRARNRILCGDQLQEGPKSDPTSIEATSQLPREAPTDDIVNTEHRLTVPVAIITILAATALLSLNTEFATDSVQSLMENSVSSSFVGLVILPIISLDTGAIKYALHNSMDLAIALSLGRCMQNALMVVPLTVLLAWCMSIDDMSLQFDAFTITILFISMVILGYVVQEGKSNWLTGALLVKIFVIIALASWWMP